jgi:hypothetical protein
MPPRTRRAIGGWGFRSREDPPKGECANCKESGLVEHSHMALWIYVDFKSTSPHKAPELDEHGNPK